MERGSEVGEDTVGPAVAFILTPSHYVTQSCWPHSHCGSPHIQLPVLYPAGTPQTQQVPNWLLSLPLHPGWHSLLHPVHSILINHPVPLIQMPEFLSAIFSFLPLVLYSGLVQTCLFSSSTTSLAVDTSSLKSSPSTLSLYACDVPTLCIRFFSGSLFPTWSHPLP